MADPSTTEQAEQSGQPIRADIRFGYRVRFAIAALVLIGMGIYALADGLYFYPAHNQHRAASLEALEQYRQTHGSLEGWPTHAREHGYAQDPTRLEEKGILSQYIMAGLCLPAGLAAAVYYLVLGRRWVRADADGLRTNSGRHAPWDALASIDKSRWQRKGIAVVHYNDRGAPRRITLDDWKYDTEATEQILAATEARLQLSDETAADKHG
ncbi:MAG: hypothetical protein ACODAQ_06740 [Phycisphaeraceae bacterium]